MYDQAGSCASALTSPHPSHQWPLLLQLPASSFTSKAMLKSPNPPKRSKWRPLVCRSIKELTLASKTKACSLTSKLT